MSSKISVAQYLPVNGNARHWALYLETPLDGFIYQITGEPMAFKFAYGHRESVNPKSSTRFAEFVFVCEIDSNNVEEVKNMLEFSPIENDIATWGCRTGSSKRSRHSPTPITLMFQPKL
ncbi:hypothetical protein BD779DRAFT_1447786 [Infundibulicybe gibba]|nr:hypothetical protein BD779DRAFT_1447786 [Infundibulicybe gibba]